jgi:hypothetical protein
LSKEAPLNYWRDSGTEFIPAKAGRGRGVPPLGTAAWAKIPLLCEGLFFDFANKLGGRHSKIPKFRGPRWPIRLVRIVPILAIRPRSLRFIEQALQ